MTNKLNQTLIMGAASMAAGIVKALTTALTTRKKTWPEKAKDAASGLAHSASGLINKKLLLGTVAGGLIGVTTALLLAPKAGSELLNGFYNPKKAKKGAKKDVITKPKKAVEKKQNPKEPALVKAKKVVRKAVKPAKIVIA